MKCFYHNADLDGHCSGAIVKYKYPECEMIGINYGDTFLWDRINKGETVFMVDFCLQPFEDMERLNSMCKLIWIDHHKSAIVEAERRNFVASGGQKLEIGKGACELCWEYLFPNEKLPLGIELLGRYDVWDLDYDPYVLPFQYGMKSRDTDPASYDRDVSVDWRNIFLNHVNFLEKCIEEGKTILRYIQKENKKYVKQYCFKTEINGIPALAVNKGLANSQLFDSIWDISKHPIVITFVWHRDKWTVSLYTTVETGIDVSEIAKSYGGGGHKCAAGFQCKELPFRLG